MWSRLALLDFRYYSESSESGTQSIIHLRRTPERMADAGDCGTGFDHPIVLVSPGVTTRIDGAGAMD